MNAVPLKDALTAQQLRWVEDQLSNNEVSSDEELATAFVADGMTPSQAKEVLEFRDDYRLNMYHQDHTPIRVGRDQAQTFNPSSKTFEPVRRRRPR